MSARSFFLVLIWITGCAWQAQCLRLHSESELDKKTAHLKKSAGHSGLNASNVPKWMETVRRETKGSGGETETVTRRSLETESKRKDWMETVRRDPQGSRSSKSSRRHSARKSSKRASSRTSQRRTSQRIHRPSSRLSLKRPAGNIELDGSISLVTYNVEFMATDPKYGEGKNLSANQLAAIQNVAQYLAEEDPDFVVIPEATESLMSSICNPIPDVHHILTSNHPGATLGTWGHNLSSSSRICGYMMDYAGPEGIAILYKHDVYEVKLRSCNVGDIYVDRLSEAYRLHHMEGWDNCVNLEKGFTFGRGRGLLMAHLQHRTRAADSFGAEVIIIAVHVGHFEHAKSLSTLASATQLFSESIKMDGFAGPVIIAGDMNTHTRNTKRGNLGIHTSLDAMLQLGLNERSAMGGTWPLRGRKSFNNAFQQWRTQHAFSEFGDAAEQKYNVARGHDAASGDDLTCCLAWNSSEWSSARSEKLGVKKGMRLDHILFAYPTSFRQRIFTDTRVRRPQYPSSDHLPVSMKSLALERRGSKHHEVKPVGL